MVGRKRGAMKKAADTSKIKARANQLYAEKTDLAVVKSKLHEEGHHPIDIINAIGEIRAREVPKNAVIDTGFEEKRKRELERMEKVKQPKEVKIKEKKEAITRGLKNIENAEKFVKDSFRELIENPKIQQFGPKKGGKYLFASQDKLLKLQLISEVKVQEINPESLINVQEGLHMKKIRLEKKLKELKE